jgi:predicted GNAT superfamily acetyltransferase
LTGAREPATVVWLHNDSGASSAQPTMSNPAPGRDRGAVRSSPSAHADDSARRAQADADAAAAASGVIVRELVAPREHHAAELLLSEVWATGPAEPTLPAHVTRTLAVIGSYVAGAYDPGGELVGVGAGFLTADTPSLGAAHLHSHITGVTGRARGRHVGFALKLHQRAWALQRGIDRVTWTFDPLVARNAYFNLVKLGAEASAYFSDFYGGMSDGINAGQGSDRLLALWQLRTPATEQAIRGRRPWPEQAGLIPTDRVLLRPDDRGAPRYSAFITEGGADPSAAGGLTGLAELSAAGPLACIIPTDIERMRRQDQGLSLAWREAVRTVLGGAMGARHHVVGFTRSGCYLLDRVPRPATYGPRPEIAHEEADS